MSEGLQARVDELERRLFNQSMQLARLHAGLKRLFNAVPDMAITIAEYDAAKAVLDACEADGDQVVRDIRIALAEIESGDRHDSPFTWDETDAALERLRALAAE